VIALDGGRARPASAGSQGEAARVWTAWGRRPAETGAIPLHAVTNKKGRDTMHRGNYLHLALLVGTLALAGWSSPPASADVPGWMDQTFGDTIQGSATIDSNGVITIKGAGADTWAREDEFHILYKPLKGEGSITTKMLSGEEGHSASKIGVVMRNDLKDSAAQVVHLIQTPTGGGQEINRGVAGEEMSMDFKSAKADYQIFPRTIPVWLKIERRGNHFTQYASNDGVLWVPVTRALHIVMQDEIVAGLSVMSHVDDELLTGTFDGKVTDVSPRLLKPEEATPLQPNPVIALGGNNSVTLTWDRVSHLGKEADGYVVSKANVGEAEFTKIQELPGDQTSFTDDKIKNGEQAQYRVTTIVKVGAAGDKVLETQDFGDTLYAVIGSPNPPIQIGNRQYNANILEGGPPEAATATPGSASVDSSGVATLRASGWDINDRNDGGEQLVTPVTDDFTFTARMIGPPSVEGGDVNEDAKFGIAVRETTLSDSRYAGILVTPQHGIRAPHRRLFETGKSLDAAPNEDTPAYPVYLRIQRRGEEIKTFTSADGNTYKEYGSPASTVLRELAPKVYVGLIGTSHDNDQVAQARFDKIELTTP
jgi:hypothetical protein